MHFYTFFNVGATIFKLCMIVSVIAAAYGGYDSVVPPEWSNVKHQNQTLIQHRTLSHDGDGLDVAILNFYFSKTQYFIGSMIRIKHLIHDLLHVHNK